jgi:hypothetical protein
MEIDVGFRGKKFDDLVVNAAAGASRIYKHVTEQHGWFKKLNGFDDFSLPLRT